MSTDNDRQQAGKVEDRSPIKLLLEGATARSRIALLEGERLVEVDVEGGKPSRVGEVYLGRVQRLAPAIDAAFVNVGLARNAFLHESDFGRQLEGERLAANQPLIVQVMRDELPGKGARVRHGATLPGRYVVLLAGAAAPLHDRVAVSLRIADNEERARLVAVLEDVGSAEAGWIARTAAQGVAGATIRADAEQLLVSWRGIVSRAAAAPPPRCLHRELGAAARWLRDRASDALEEIWVDSAGDRDQVAAILGSVAPELVDRVRLHEEAVPLFQRFGVERQLEALWHKRVRLPSGGSLVIEPTEALVAIDVNSGRDFGAANLEATALATNLEAAAEVARQIRLRDLAGIIVIDFIDLEVEQGWDEVRQVMTAELDRDRAATVVEGPVAFGLMTITRRRQRGDLISRLSTECACCRGTGRVRAPREVVAGARRALLAHEAAQPGRRWRLRLHPSVLPAVEVELADLDAMFGERLQTDGDADLRPAAYALDEQAAQREPQSEAR